LLLEIYLNKGDNIIMMDKETIKEFLKPDWRKAVMFVTLVFIVLVFPGIPIIIYSWGYTKGLEFVSILRIGWIITFLHTLDIYIQIAWHLLFIELIILYPISCLIIFACSKFRDKKQ